MEDGPKTLLEAVQYFKDDAICIQYLAAKRWPDGKVICPTCGGDRVHYLREQKRWQCSNRHPKRQFSIKVGTIMEDSPIGLDKWMPVMWLIANCRNGISSWEIHRALGVTQKTAWFMLHRIRLAMQDDFTGGMLGGEVEVDEKFIGGKARNMHKNRKRKAERQWGKQCGKAIVMGMLERETEKKPKRGRASVVADRSAASLRPEVRAHVEPGTTIRTDEFAYFGACRIEYEHSIINHTKAYVEGNVHTNGLENFWSLLKRGIGGTLRCR